MSDKKKPIEDWDGDPISVERFGKDHWSTFAYIETRIVDYKGITDERHMRGHRAGWERYPTLLRDAILEGHNDFDCARDAMVAGLLTYEDPDAVESPLGSRTQPGPRFALTAKGKVVAAKLRAYKGAGGNFATFDPGPVLGWMAAGR